MTTFTTYESRLAALNLARDITAPGSDPKTLIEAAQTIEHHLLGLPQPVAEDGTLFLTPNGISAKPPEPDPAAHWSGSAQDLLRLFDQGNVLVCKARRVGMTTLLANYAAAKSRTGSKVLFLSPSQRMALAAKELFIDEKGDTANVDFSGLNMRFNEVAPFEGAFTGRHYDLIIVDGLASLPYSAEPEFISTVMTMAKHYIFSSEPGQKMGLFYDLWKKSPSFSKVVLTWHTPLFPSTPERAKDIETIKHNLSDERFRNEFECEFREIKE